MNVNEKRRGWIMRFGDVRASETSLHLASIVFSALGYVAAQPPANRFWLAPFCMVPWLCVVARSSRLIASLSAVALGAAIGILMLHWIPESLSALGHSRATATSAWLTVAVWYFGIPWGVFGVAARFAVLCRFESLGIVAFGAIVGGIEALRTFPSSAVTAWALLGHSQASTGMAQIAVLGGVPLISALLAALNLSVARWVWYGRVTPVPSILLGAAIAALAFGTGVVSWVRSRTQPDLPTRVLLVQPAIPWEDRWVADFQLTNLRIVKEFTERAVAIQRPTPLDVVVWPETVMTTPSEEGDQLGEALRGAVSELSVPMVIGLATPAKAGNPRAYRNSAVSFDRAGLRTDSIDKAIGIPLMEDADGWAGALRWLFRFPNGVSMESGNDERPLRGERELATLLCYEALVPPLAGSRRTPSTLALLNLANDDWLTSQTAAAQQLAFAEFRAIEQRLWLIRVAHGGSSMVVDALGRRVAELPWGARGTLEVTVWREAPASIAEKALLAGCLVAGGIVGMLGFGLTRRISCTEGSR
jgi:apolipoprotein N-acyltransferase